MRTVAPIQEAREPQPAHPILSSDSQRCDRKWTYQTLETQCGDDAEFKVKLGTVWGHYCGEHTIEFMRSDGWNPEEGPIFPIDYEVSE